jgi:hypothetical protein
MSKLKSLRKAKKASAFQRGALRYTARFGKDDDQTTVTEEQRRERQKTAAEGVDQ